MANKTLKARLITNSAVASVWTTTNPVLLKGEIGIENDTRKFKFGDGVTTWNQLKYASSSGVEIENRNPGLSDVMDLGALWLNSETNIFYYLASTDGGNAIWKQIITPDDLSDLGMGDMLKATFATNEKSSQGYVDKAILADSSAKLATPHDITLTGDTTGSASFDGTANAQITTTLKDSGVTSGTYPKVIVNSKGIITGGTDLVASDIPSIPNTKVTGLGTASTKNTGSNAGEIPVLTVNGKLEEGMLPAIAITDSEAVSSEAEMLALDVQKGDIAIRTDVNKTFILSGANPSVLSNWLELRTPTDAVLSVSGKTGAVTLNKSDVGLSNVDNTSDENKPVSTATQTALNTKVDKVEGKGLSTEDFTSDEKTKLSGIETGAEKNKVTSVAGKQGAVTLSASDLTNGSDLLLATDTFILDGGTHV